MVAAVTVATVSPAPAALETAETAAWGEMPLPGEGVQMAARVVLVETGDRSRYLYRRAAQGQLLPIRAAMVAKAAREAQEEQQDTPG